MSRLQGKSRGPYLSLKAAPRIREFITWTVFAPQGADELAAIAIQEETKLAFWDAMVVHAAVESGCETLWSKDLNDGQTVRGVRIRNPFTPSTRNRRTQMIGDCRLQIAD